MAQNIYDDPGFFAGYAQLPRSRQGLDGAPEWPALRAQLPPMVGLRVVDLGCGYGWFCRWAREQGAATVLGLDLSERMLDQARNTTGDPAIDYRQADLEQLELPPGAFDLAYSSLAFHYIENLPRLLRQVHAALVPGGRLVFSIEHPIFMAPSNPGWVIDDQGRRTWPLDAYQTEGRRSTDWLADGVIKYHRTLGTLLNALIGIGFQLAHLEEWGPSDAEVEAQPALAEERERPMMLLVSAHRPA
ncbi:class I SAM-dependent methyltransferase [Pseudomonas solani]|uniref:class I SAM-dependent methyltransferase n=1 Tax=Pseudomonas solani TaxID=2731552 RepID=UPI003C30C1D9